MVWDELRMGSERKVSGFSEATVVLGLGPGYFSGKRCERLSEMDFRKEIAG
jgi:hypothetical protein